MAQISDLIDNAEFTSQFIKSKFLSYEADFVRKEIKLLQKNHSIYFTDETFESLFAAYIADYPPYQNETAGHHFCKTAGRGKKKKEYEWTLACLKRLEPVFAIRFPEEEAVYLTLHIIGGKVRYPSQRRKKRS